VTTDPRLDTNRAPSSAAALDNPTTSQRAPIRGPVGGREPGITPWTDAPPTANPTPGGR
jgi:hypothetical protein